MQAHFGSPPGAAGTASKHVSLPGLGFDGSNIEGVAFQKKNIPDDLEYDIIEVAARSERGLETVLLNPSTTLRAGQVPDMFSFACKSMVESPPAN